MNRLADKRLRSILPQREAAERLPTCCNPIEQRRIHVKTSQPDHDHAWCFVSGTIREFEYLEASSSKRLISNLAKSLTSPILI